MNDRKDLIFSLAVIFALNICLISAVQDAYAACKRPPMDNYIRWTSPAR